MAIGSRDYVLARPPLDLESYRALADEVVQFVASRDGGKMAIRVYWKILRSPDEVEDEYVEQSVIDRVCAATGGTFPFLAVNCTYNPEEYADDWFPAAETEFELRLMKSGIQWKHPWS